MAQYISVHRMDAGHDDAQRGGDVPQEPCAQRQTVHLFVAGFALSLMSFVDIITSYKIPEMFCATFILIWECCIRIGLVPSNTNYSGFFEASTLSAQLADGEGNVIFCSSGAMALMKEQLCQARDGMLALDQDTRLRSHAIHGGRIYWTDSIQSLNRIRQQPEEAAGTLAEDNELVRAENEVRLRRAQLEEQNRLYDGMLPPVRKQLEAIRALTEQLTPDAPDLENRMTLCCVYGAYVKWRCNLALMQETEASTGVQELALCIRESISYLAVLGVTAHFRQQGEGALRPSGIMLAYDCFAAAMEADLPGLSALLVNLNADATGVTLRLTMADAAGALPQE